MDDKTQVLFFDEIDKEISSRGDMKKCPRCNGEYKKEFEVCPHCGYVEVNDTENGGILPDEEDEQPTSLNPIKMPDSC